VKNPGPRRWGVKEHQRDDHKPGSGSNEMHHVTSYRAQSGASVAGRSVLEPRVVLFSTPLPPSPSSLPRAVCPGRLPGLPAPITGARRLAAPRRAQYQPATALSPPFAAPWALLRKSTFTVARWRQADVAPPFTASGPDQFTGRGARTRRTSGGNARHPFIRHLTPLEPSHERLGHSTANHKEWDHCEYQAEVAGEGISPFPVALEHVCVAWEGAGTRARNG